MSHPTPDRPGRGLRLLLITVFVAGAQLLAAAPEGLAVLGSELPELCPWRWGGGAGCPGCGTTRAAVSLLRLDPAAAWSFQPAVFALAALPLAGLLRPCLGAAHAARLRRAIAALFAAIACLRFLLS